MPNTGIVTVDVTRDLWHNCMIKCFKCKHTEKIFNGITAKKFSGIERQAFKRLKLLDSAEDLKELAGFPSNQLEGLKGDRRGQYSIRINRQWRICFEWDDDGASEVEIVDYH